jgi:hypothetical protein
MRAKPRAEVSIAQPHGWLLVPQNGTAPLYISFVKMSRVGPESLVWYRPNTVFWKETIVSNQDGPRKVIELVRKQALLANSAQAQRLLKNAGAIPRNFRKVVPKPEPAKKKWRAWGRPGIALGRSQTFLKTATLTLWGIGT